jgi:hypothetical protein
VVAIVHPDNIQFVNEGNFMHENLRRVGITIPAGDTVNFQGRSVVYPTDQAEFIRAFKKYYIPNVLLKSGFFQRFHTRIGA